MHELPLCLIFPLDYWLPIGLARKKTGGPDFVHTPPGGRLRGNRAESDALLRTNPYGFQPSRKPFIAHAWAVLYFDQGVSEDLHT
jgi:hypothetical protein